MRAAGLPGREPAILLTALSGHRPLGRAVAPLGGRLRLSLLSAAAGGTPGWEAAHPGPEPPGAASGPGLPAPVHLHLINAGRGLAALDVSDVLRAGETRPLQPLGTGCFTLVSPAARPLQAGRRAHLWDPALAYAALMTLTG